MNRKHQSQRTQGMQSQPMRGSQTYGQSHEQDYDRANMSGARQDQYQFQKENTSGLNSSYNDDLYESDRSSSSYRDADYDLDGSTYGNQSRSQRDMSGRSSRTSIPSERYNASSERFGYPSNMNSWSGNERSTGAGSRSAGRMGQSNFNSWGAAEDDSYTDSSRMGMNSQSQSHDDVSSRRNDSWSQTDTGSQRGFFGKGPKGYKRSDDRIKEDVCETLARHSRVDASDIEVKVEDACVTLSGTVDSKEIKRAAEMAIENLSGVDDVRNEIRVKKLDMDKRMDSSIHASSSGASTSSKSSKGSSHL